MREFSSKQVTLTGLFIYSFGSFNHLCLVYDHKCVVHYKDEITEAKMNGISRVLNDDSLSSNNAFSIPFENDLLDKPINCCLVFENDAPIAIGDEYQKVLCDLATGNVIGYETFFETNK